MREVCVCVCEGGMENTQGQRERRGEWKACEGKRERVVCVCGKGKRI